MNILAGRSKAGIVLQPSESFASAGGMKLDNSKEKNPETIPENSIKNETFDEFLSRAYDQLTPEEQVRFRQKY